MGVKLTDSENAVIPHNQEYEQYKLGPKPNGLGARIVKKKLLPKQIKIRFLKQKIFAWGSTTH
jgi:hypothetical protein